MGDWLDDADGEAIVGILGAGACPTLSLGWCDGCEAEDFCAEDVAVKGLTV